MSMNINPAAAASIAGTSRAAARGGEADSQTAEANRQQDRVNAPAGKSGEAAVDAGEETDDRGADGRQLLDSFERSEPEDHHDGSRENSAEEQSEEENIDSSEGLDLQM